MAANRFAAALFGFVACAAAFAAAPAPAPTPAQPSNAIAVPFTPTVGVAVEAHAKTQAATRAHNAALLSRRDQCVARVRQGLIKATATAQLRCILQGGGPSQPHN